MADIVVESKRGDRNTSLLVQLVFADGSAPDISSALPSAFKFHFKNLETGAVFTGTGTVAIEDVPTAELSYAKAVADVAVVAEYSIEVEWTVSAGVTETFPVCDRYIWRVIPDIA
jgi:hypothetical protein